MPYLTSAQIESEMTALAASAPTICRKIALPNKTVSEGVGPTTYSYLNIAKNPSGGVVTVLAVAGLHAREWAQPDAVISFARALIAAYQNSTAFSIAAYTDTNGNTHGPVTVPVATIKNMVDRLEILLLPLANPDGRTFCMADPANFRWRKNRAPRKVVTNDATVGVDLNRNFDIAWDFDVYYNNAFAGSSNLHASKDAAEDNFIGKSLPPPDTSHPKTEPEVTNLIWLLSNHRATFSIDLHSWGPLVMHPWGIEQNGNDPTQTFQNTAFDKKRDGTSGTTYREFFPNTSPTRLLDRHSLLAGSMRDGIQAATGRTYKAGGTADLIYAASGTFSDFHFSQQFIGSHSPAIYSFAVEFGDIADTFQPKYADPHGYPRIEREVHAVLLRLLEAALPPPPPPPPTGDSGRSSKGCIFSMVAADFAGGHAWLQALRGGRAVLLNARPTRRAMLALDAQYRRVSSVLIPRVANRRWMRVAIAYGIVAPSANLTALALRWSAR
jgi:hypothetical protein